MKKTFEKNGAKLMVVGPAYGFTNPSRPACYWIKVVSGIYNSFDRGQEFLMSAKTLNKILGGSK